MSVAMSAVLSQHPAEASATVLQTFDVSNNSFTGPVPPFLYANNVPPWAQPTIFIQARGTQTLTLTLTLRSTLLISLP